MELKEVAVVGYSASKKNADMAEADSVAVDSVDEGKDPRRSASGVVARCEAPCSSDDL